MGNACLLLTATATVATNWSSGIVLLKEVTSNGVTTRQNSGAEIITFAMVTTNVCLAADRQIILTAFSSSRLILRTKSFALKNRMSLVIITSRTMKVIVWLLRTIMEIKTLQSSDQNVIRTSVVNCGNGWRCNKIHFQSFNENDP